MTLDKDNEEEKKIYIYILQEKEEKILRQKNKSRAGQGGLINRH